MSNTFLQLLDMGYEKEDLKALSEDELEILYKAESDDSFDSMFPNGYDDDADLNDD